MRQRQLRSRFPGWAVLVSVTLWAMSAGGSALSQVPLSNLPEITLQRGEGFFRVSGNPSFLLGQNLTGTSTEDLQALLARASQSGERIVRIQITSGPRPLGMGEVDEAWALWWDHIFDLAAQNGLYVLPVFSQWADWNDGSQKEIWHFWERNPYNAALGGPATCPADLLRDTPTRLLWLEWLRKLVMRWQGRPNTLGWEIFSELDLISGATEADAVNFVDSAARVIRATDTRSRPVTASLSGINDWPKLSRSSALDFIEVHPYANLQPFNGNLDELVLSVVRQRLKQYRKPVFIGESGLDARPPVNTLTVAARAFIGIKQAIWAQAVSGAMNGRMLWWEDGYDTYYHLDLRGRYKDASVPVACFIRDVDYSGFHPIDIVLTPTIKGAALGNEQVVLGWVRDTMCVAPDWPVRPLRGLSVTVAVPGGEQDWKAEFYATDSGELFNSASARRAPGGISVGLPPFKGSVAFKIRALNTSSPAFTPGSRALPYLVAASVTAGKECTSALAGGGVASRKRD